MMKRVKIDSLAFGGFGVGRIDGRVVFVPYSAPGDELSVEITKERKGYLEGCIHEIHVPSSIRQEPPCKHHAVCGGCHWLHIQPQSQLTAKEEIFRDTLKRIGKVDTTSVRPIIASPSMLGYRSRVQFKVDKGRIGFFKRGTHEVVDIETCPLAHEAINIILQGMRGIRRFLPPTVKGIDVDVSPSEKKGIVSLYLTGASDKGSDAFFRLLSDTSQEVTGMCVHYEKGRKRIFGSPHIFLQEGNFRFRASAGNFYQINYSQNMKIKEDIIRIAGLQGDESVIDLFSGIGNFTIPLATGCRRAIGIEVNRSSVSDARENCLANKIDNAIFIEASADRPVQHRIEEAFSFTMKEPAQDSSSLVDIVVMDPPRDGCSGELIREIAGLCPRKIIYVSCNPSTLSRDLQIFNNAGFSISYSRPYDMFPHTFHMESITEIVRK